MAGNRGRGTRGKNPQTSDRIAQTAARLMAEEGIRDFGFAKRKAADQLGIPASRSLPTNQEVERALIEYQRLFRSHSQPAHLLRLRQAAATAMRLLERFEPRLAGPVLGGTADENYPVTLHLFAEPPEAVGLFLDERDIPHDLQTRRLRVDAERIGEFPLYRFVAGEVTFELTVFPLKGIRQSPPNPVDGRPMPRANLAAVEALVAEDVESG